jgi:hypothetical protein
MQVARHVFTVRYAYPRRGPATALLAILACSLWPGFVTAADPATTEPEQKAAAEPDAPVKWVCRHERPTGSRKSVKVCREKSVIEDSAEFSRESLKRSQHYGNPTVTPPG